jgi:60 kDa SS-A/Ro ribonucleoprotein
LRDAAEIQRARVFPYQLMTAYRNRSAAVPAEVRDALQDAMELAIKNVPALKGSIVVCPDVSGSMASPVTGHRTGATSVVRCIDVAALIAASVLRKNPSAKVLPFDFNVVPLKLNPRDSVMTNAALLAAIGGGGTNCSAPLRLLNEQKAKADLVILVSDNESWVDQGGARGTQLMVEWAAFRQRNPKARLVCLDIQPSQTTQAAERVDILNIGGFSDQAFEVISSFASGILEPNHWMARIEAVAV